MTDPGDKDKKEAAAAIEFPDEAGYPDGIGTLDEGTSTEEAESADEEANEEADEIEHFAESDTEDE